MDRHYTRCRYYCMVQSISTFILICILNKPHSYDHRPHQAREPQYSGCSRLQTCWLETAVGWQWFVVGRQGIAAGVHFQSLSLLLRYSIHIFANTHSLFTFRTTPNHVKKILIPRSYTACTKLCYQSIPFEERQNNYSH